MKKITTIYILFAFLLPPCMAQEITRIEPPFWWASMNDNTVQLMLYGKDLGHCSVECQGEGIRVTASHAMPNPNYLFVDLLLSDEAEPGTYTFMLESCKGSRTHFDYTLKERAIPGIMRKGFDASDVLYLITPDRFANGDPDNDVMDGLREGLNRQSEYGRHGGDIKGIIDHLDYIEEMGFTAIWLNPVLENDQEQWSYHGYATTDYYRVDPRFGTNEDYLELCRLASDRGIGVIMDVIVNHCGSRHWWMDDLPGPDWINRVSEGYTETNHRKTTLVDPYVSERDREIMTKGWFVPAMPDLNQHNPFMSTYLIQNSIWWIEYAGLYGLRQDTYSYPFRDFMTDWTCAIRKEYPNMNIVGEEWTDNPAIISYWQEGKANADGYSSCLPSLMDFPLCMAVHKALNEKESFTTGLSRIYEQMANDFQYADPSKLVIFPDNHDMSRILTQLQGDTALFQMAMVFYATMRGIPQLYYGTEILMANPGTDSHGIIRSDFPGGWAGDAVNAFTGKGLSPQVTQMQGFIRKLLNWRKTSTIIHKGNFMHFNPEDGIYVYFRYDESNALMVAMNKNTEDRQLELYKYKERLHGYTGYHDPLGEQKGLLDDGLKIPARSARIFELKK